MGFLEGIERLQIGSARVGAVSERLGAETVAIGEKFTAGSARLAQISKNLGAEKGLQPSLAAMRDIAKDLDSFSDELDPLNVELREALDDVIVGANAVARFRSISENIDPEVVEGELSSLQSLGTTLVETYVNTIGFSTTVASLPPMESHLTRSARRAAGVVAETAAIVESAQAEIERAEGLLRERLEARESRP